MSTCKHPFNTENNPAEIENMHTSKISNNDINVDKCIEISSEQVKQFHQTLPEGFYNPFSKQVKTMSILEKSICVNDEEIIDTFLTYSRVIVLQLTNAAMTVENIFKHEFAPIPTSIFNDDSDLRSAKSKPDMKRALEFKVLTCTMSKPELMITDRSEILWVVN